MPGLDLPFVKSVDSVLSGRVRLSGRVLVIDQNGHWEGASTAEFLADDGCEVHVATPAFHVLGDIEGGNRLLYLRRGAPCFRPSSVPPMARVGENTCSCPMKA